MADADKVGACASAPDPAKNGIPCRDVTDPNACYTYACVDGACTAIPDQTKLGQPCINDAVNVTVCNKLVCAVRPSVQCLRAIISSPTARCWRTLRRRLCPRRRHHSNVQRRQRLHE